MARLLTLLLVLGACGGGADDGPEADGAPGPDGGAELDASLVTGCETTGDGTLYAQCCVWGERACGPGLACYWHQGSGLGEADSGCFAPGEVGAGEACDPGMATCADGLLCYYDGTGTTGVCSSLCAPPGHPGPGCPAPLTCQVPGAFSDGTIGVCL